jgi:hypothetical protein
MKRSRLVNAPLAVAAAVAACALTACSADSMGAGEGEGGTAQGTIGGPSGSSGQGGAASGSGIGGGFDPSTGSGQGDAGVDPDAACATSSEEATLIPVNMFITVDKSGSMDDDGKWNAAKAAFTAFFKDPEASSLRVALRFWPDGNCNESSCSIDGCSQPQVDIGPLSDPAHVDELVELFNAKDPDGLTPMWAALGGATKWATQYATQAEGAEKVVVILVTDGEPTACPENINEIAQHAKNAYEQAGILTFAVGLAGSNESQMNVIAQAGNTQKGFFIGNGNAQTDLLAALKAIQKSAVACVFAMPEGEPQHPVDAKKVNIVYTPSSGGAAVTFGQVGSKDECGPAGGWFYDDPLDPAIIELCPATCDLVQADEGAKIQILLGCESTPA